MDDVVIFDVDGVFTPGNFFYTKEGKVAKEFGPDDYDAVRELMKHADVHIVTADKKGWPIVKKRFQDEMGWKTDLVPNKPVDARWKWIKENYPNKYIIYVADGIYDWYCLGRADYSICPADSLPHIIDAADYCSSFTGGRRFVADACIHIMQELFDNWDRPGENDE
jgi:N-acylneuraminate cytidylyltransferase